MTRRSRPFAGSPTDSPARIVVVMGVSGSGKSTLGALLAAHLHCSFNDGDDLHAPDSIAKMRAGIGLEDADRWPWLASIASVADRAARRDGHVVIACSALKRSYRDCIREHTGCPVSFVLLEADDAELGRRMAARGDHYMPASLLHSQLQLLEVPGPGERARSFETRSDPAGTLGRIIAWLKVDAA